jgi:hypothetical protein
MGRGRHAHKRIGGAYARCERLAIDIRFEAIAQKASVAVVDPPELPRDGAGLAQTNWDQGA